MKKQNSKSGDVLRKFRENAGLSQMELAEKMGYTTSQIVSNWERGMCGLPPKKASAFCGLTGMKMDSLKKMLVGDMLAKADKKLAVKYVEPRAQASKKAHSNEKSE